MIQRLLPVLLALAAILPAPAVAQTARDYLAQASFGERSRDGALRRIASAEAAAAAALRERPDDREARLMQVTALGYRAKLTGSRGQAIEARKGFEAIVARDPAYAEAQLALGAWHMGAVNRLGALGARAILGGQRSAGQAALDRAVAAGGGRALFPGLAALLRLKADPGDARGRQLAEAASRAQVRDGLDRAMQRAAVAVLIPLRSGNADAARAVATRSLPFGAFDK